MILSLLITLLFLQNPVPGQISIESGKLRSAVTTAAAGNNYILILNRFTSNDSLLLRSVAANLGEEITLYQIENIFRQRLQIDLDSAIWFSSLRIQDIGISRQADSLLLNFFVFYQQKAAVHLDTISFNGQQQTDPAKLIRESRLQIGQLLKPVDISSSADFLSRSLFVEQLYSADLRRFGENRYGIHYELKELSTFFLNGIIGYVPGKTGEDPLFTYDLQIAYDNMAGSGRAIDLNWKKLNRQSETIELSYTEPWLLGEPLNGRLDVKRYLVDSIFTKTSFSLSLDIAINQHFTASVFGTLSNINPTDSIRAASNIVPFSEDTETGVAIRYTTTNRKYNPSNGLRSVLQFSHANSDILRPDWLIERFDLKTNSQKNRIEFDIDYFINHYDNHVLLFKNSSRYIETDQLFSSERYYFGGTKTIRGFRENQYNSRWYSQFTTEYRLLTSIDTRLFLFSDIAYFERPDKSTARIGSYGFGARLKTAIGILGVDYALEAGSPFRDGKIHVGIYGKIQ
ncbi:MAG: BamA/TamA family outer membrane protein [Calditrichaeota bacterium]|nr:BamA/TamA family outer membrane protein [Calditrichota bacterium]